ncbi:hypothetical protein [Rhodobacter maris]|uniref:Uncharacterized protein n=1 Tax=Rhodobacter maris TaxID=446682 RepID=A0A285SVP3_9RHOB|nr:hypothetical protein [Rhodobacter maris]SOC12062.1 hypothetical protein SAMN05877831_109112 [Rhodobacter maris]
MGRILQAVIVLVALAALGVLGYAYFGDMEADPVQTRAPVTLPGLVPEAPAAALPAAPAAPSVPESAPVFGGTPAAPAEAAGGN